jgi:hypothetical protein
VYTSVKLLVVAATIAARKIDAKLPLKAFKAKAPSFHLSAQMKRPNVHKPGPKMPAMIADTCDISKLLECRTSLDAYCRAR